jgi:nucleotide-binding universal stress UspA family protein
MKIILTTDFSDENKMLFPYAIDLLRLAGGKIIVFHAYMDQFILGDSVFPGGIDSDAYFNREVVIEMENQAQNLMKETVNQLETLVHSQKLDNISIDMILQGGDPELELVHVTEQEKPDLILMGMRGKGRKGFLEGSMSKSIMTKVNVPVLAIPESYQWSMSSQVLYATNFGPDEEKVIRKLYGLLKPYNPLIHVVHLQLKDQDEQASAQLELLSNCFQTKEMRQQIRFHCIRTTSAREALQLFCEQHHVSLASFIANKRSLWDYIFKDKVGKDDFYSLNLPLLTFSAE